MAILFPVLFIAENLPPWQCALASLQTITRQKHASNQARSQTFLLGGFF